MLFFRIVIIFLFIHLQLNIYAQTWEKTYNHTEYGEKIFQTFDNGYISVGEDYPCVITKYNSTGDTLWTKLYNSQVLGTVKPTYDNGYLVLTKAFFSINPDIYIEKLNNQGDTLWSKTISASDPGMAQSIVETTDSLYMFTYQESNDLHIVKIDIHGNIIFNKIYASYSFNPLMTDLASTSDGGCISLTESSVFSIVKINQNGDTLWSKSLSAYNDLNNIKQTSDGGYILTGEKNDSLLLLKLTPQGISQWEKTFSNGFYDIGSHVAPTTDGGFIIIGTSLNSASSTDSYLNLMKTNSSGDTIWTRKYGIGNSASGAYVEQTIDGGYILTGQYGFSPQLYVIKTNLLGSLSLNTSITKTKPINNLAFFPNPVSQKVNINLGKQYKEVSVNIINSFGQIQSNLVFFNKKNISPNIEGNSGVYFVRIITSENEESTLKIIKNK